MYSPVEFVDDELSFEDEFAEESIPQEVNEIDLDSQHYPNSFNEMAFCEVFGMLIEDAVNTMNDF